MRILPAILAHARRVALDVAGLLLGLVEGRREQLDDLELVVDQHACIADCIAVLSALGSPCPESTLHD